MAAADELMALKKASRPGEPPRARQACMAPKAISSLPAQTRRTSG